MTEFRRQDTERPASLAEVGAAVKRLSKFGEADILEMVSTGKIRDLFPFRANNPDELPPDTVDEAELMEASPMPRSAKPGAPQ